ncbi:TPA: hypothetical protein ACH3X2_005790 [Trebouxia sp. C0005]
MPCSLRHCRGLTQVLSLRHIGSLCNSSEKLARVQPGTGMSAVAIAFGSNMGDSVANIQAAVRQLPTLGIQVVRQSRLYESAPAYVTDQPTFVNGAIAALTPLQPLELLDALKTVEAASGRNFAGQRFGPRPLDLDIIFYSNQHVQHDRLCIPHPRWQERDFVKAPLLDLFTPEEDLSHSPWQGLAEKLAAVRNIWRPNKGGEVMSAPDLQPFIPLPDLPNWPWQQRTWIMGILNATPDSFSDGGQVKGVLGAVEHACMMVKQGADIVDVGGQSTRPGATRLTTAEEVQRVVPVIRAMRETKALQKVPISIDTFDAEVASQAVAAGAHMVNDVSGGLMDPNMHAQVARLNVPYILMHMRGNPSTMQSMTQYTDTCLEVGQEMQVQAEAAMNAGIEPWRIILDPGVGFAKTGQGNLEVMCGLQQIRSQLKGCLQGMPLLLGPSRKGFLGKLTGRANAADRDYATAAAAAMCISRGANIIRAHNVAAVKDAAAVADALACTAHARHNQH